MSKRTIDLDAVREAMARLEKLAREHPELTTGDRPRQLAEDLEEILNVTRQDTFTVKEAAHVLGRSVETVRRLIRRGELKAAKVGRDYIISGADLEAYYQSKGGGNLFPRE